MILNREIKTIKMQKMKMIKPFKITDPRIELRLATMIRVRLTEAR